MCGNKEIKNMKKVSLILGDGSEIGPVNISNLRTTKEGVLEANVYGSRSVLPNGNQKAFRFMAVYTNISYKVRPS